LINSDKFGKGVPLSLFYLDNDQFTEKTFSKPNLSYSVLLYSQGPSYSCMLLERDIARSLIMRLFLLQGKDLRYFEPFTKASDLTRRTQIMVYRVNWEKFLEDIGENSN
jgi:hypothetical protein